MVWPLLLFGENGHDDETNHSVKSADEAAIEIVTTDSRLSEVVDAASRNPRVALDLESNGLHRYPEHICLVQLAAGGSVHLIDPLSLRDMSPLGWLLADSSIQKIMHSADYDVRSFDRDWGFRISNLFDTSISAAFIGTDRLGLATVLEGQLGIVLPKSKRLQRADWTVRPLSLDAQSYAADDVLYLERLRDLLVSKLTDLGRLEWVEEECVRQTSVTYRPRDPEWAFATMKGSRALDGDGLALLRSMYGFREEEAVRRNRPPFQVIQDSILVEIAMDPRQDLAKMKGLGRYGNGREGAGLRAAVRDGIEAAPVVRPKPKNTGPRFSRSEGAASDARLRRLKEWRADLGKALQLDLGLLWPAASLERLAGDPGSLDAELVSPEVRVWQRREFGDSLRGFLASLRE